MPALQSVLADLNQAFSRAHIEELAARRAAFAPGKKLGTGLIVKKGTPLYKAYQEYLGQLPGSFHETLRGIIHYALSTEPPTPVTFAWSPGYDYELSIWHAPDTRATRGGITVLIKSRYPSDNHPLATSGGRRSARSA